MIRELDDSSPWAAALGDGPQALHPCIRRYVDRIPRGRTGIGAGVFAVVGSQMPGFAPALAVLQRQGVLARGYHRNVPFTIVNRSEAGSAPQLRADRRLQLPRGEWTMRDRVVFDRGRLTDHLGYAERYRATLVAWSRNGALRLRSTAVAIRVGRRHIRLPRSLAPVVQLRERFDERAGRQEVWLRLEHPLLGVLYEYRGRFDYRIDAEIL